MFSSSTAVQKLWRVSLQVGVMVGSWHPNMTFLLVEVCVGRENDVKTKAAVNTQVNDLRDVKKKITFCLLNLHRASILIIKHDRPTVLLENPLCSPSVWVIQSCPFVDPFQVLHWGCVVLVRSFQKPGSAPFDPELWIHPSVHSLSCLTSQKSVWGQWPQHCLCSGPHTPPPCMRGDQILVWTSWLANGSVAAVHGGHKMNCSD